MKLEHLLGLITFTVPTQVLEERTLDIVIFQKRSSDFNIFPGDSFAIGLHLESPMEDMPYMVARQKLFNGKHYYSVTSEEPEARKRIAEFFSAQGLEDPFDKKQVE